MSTLDNALQALLKMAHPDIAWTNAAPTSNFPAQTIQIDLADCEYIELAWCYGISSTANQIDIYTQKIKVGGNAGIQNNYYISSDAIMGFRTRSVNVRSNGVTFSLSSGKRVNVEEPTQTGEYQVPLFVRKIYS